MLRYHWVLANNSFKWERCSFITLYWVKSGSRKTKDADLLKVAPMCSIPTAPGSEDRKLTPAHQGVQSHFRNCVLQACSWQKQQRRSCCWSVIMLPPRPDIAPHVHSVSCWPGVWTEPVWGHSQSYRSQCSSCSEVCNVTVSNSRLSVLNGGLWAQGENNTAVILNYCRIRWSACTVGGAGGEEPAGDLRDMGLIPGLGRAPEGGHGNPLQHSCLESPYGQRSLVGYSL